MGEIEGMKTLIFDLDGVIRQLAYFREWNTQWECNIVEEVNDNMHHLLDAPPTEYYPVIKDIVNLTILTHQQPGWKPLTQIWIERYLPDANVIYVERAKDKLQHINGGLLVEDNPTLPKEAYEHIIMIDRPYNQGVECYRRARTPGELREIIEFEGMRR